MRSYKASDHAWLIACNMGYTTLFDSFWQESLTADLERTKCWWAPKPHRGILSTPSPSILLMMAFLDTCTLMDIFNYCVFAIYSWYDSIHTLGHVYPMVKRHPITESLSPWQLVFRFKLENLCLIFLDPHPSCRANEGGIVPRCKWHLVVLNTLLKNKLWTQMPFIHTCYWDEWSNLLSISVKMLWLSFSRVRTLTLVSSRRTPVETNHLGGVAQ